MKRIVVLSGFVFCIILMSGCFTTYPAMSETSYQNCINEVNNKLDQEGFLLKDKSSTEGGYHDIYRYKWENIEGECVNYTIEVHRGDNNGAVFIDEVFVSECNCSVSKNHTDDKCDTIKNNIENNQENDIEGRKFSPGDTVAAVILGSLGFGVLFGLLLVAAAA
jgi:hypothetical protein